MDRELPRATASYRPGLDVCPIPRYIQYMTSNVSPQVETHSQTFPTRHLALSYLTGLRLLVPHAIGRKIWFRTEAPNGVGAGKWTVHMYSAPRT